MRFRDAQRSDTTPKPAESFEQLDLLLEIAPARGWLFLGGLGTLLAATVCFAVFVWVPTKVEGKGIFLPRSGGLRQVHARGAGRLAHLAVKPGQTVAKGELLAIIEQDELDDRIRDAENLLTKLQEEDARATALDRAESESQENAWDAVVAAHEQLKSLAQERLELAQAIEQGDKRLLSERNLSRIEFFTTRMTVDTLMDHLAKSRSDLADGALKRTQARNLRDREALGRKLKIETQDFEFRLLKEKRERTSRVVSPYDGVVREVLKPAEAQVEMGEPVVLLEPPHGSEADALEVLLFVPAVDGKKIGKQARVLLTPTTVRKEEHGSIPGDVDEVTEFPATELAVMAQLQHRDLVTSFLGSTEHSVSVGVRVRPRFDPATRAFRWTSGAGPGFPITAGTLCHASIAVEEKRLISLVVPLLKKATGLDRPTVRP